MASSPEADVTRDRILAAAADEFAQYGVAGARIDRIARRAKSSKERLYAYFRSKQDLYRCVAERELAAMTDATRLDATDLPAYAGRVHDYFTARPDHLRLMQWGRLDVAGTDVPEDPFQEAVRQTVYRGAEQVRQAQATGHLDPVWDPIDVMVIVTQIALAWAGQLDLVQLAGDQVRNPAPSARRAAIVAAVAGLFPAGNGTNPTAAHEDRGAKS
ncbi:MULTISPECIES: TetR family transcriptional regulator [Mycolicibacterium]|uniref:TetR family transcriptional regulator n=1 Tax=Mycolicibacterium senegalense TaxID=1796 RepID=A0A378W2T7_9MYCO|nr:MULTISPECIES: TetR family transcriptional regulator [Mycolicibacterium]MCV7335929.1 TetR/AcrR family transcriptional regulator [Mycolicibacterium senegalense]MDR7288996.1 AcrR family transcriptional regulator [Mycolicibacterium senegalense]QZA25879.1 TetR/AcrR family transcriptional regulator [Mycolicibacterium senegalense]CDP84767.1 TetR family transcriptional regulator [Mycolicibacterium farcinogenes]SUA27433.1 TetR family transcriptional regulator [Mycolicibacterium senegalense]